MWGHRNAARKESTMTAAKTLASVKRAIREPYAWPGGYPLFIVMADGDALSTQSARENWTAIVHSTLTGSRDGWAAAGVEVNWEDGELTCAHSGEAIESAYGES
jgi:hypothetical protein